jgi:hypothetical protein
MPTPEQIDRYEAFPDLVSNAIEGLSETQFHFISTIGGWSIHEVVIHLADSEAVGFGRIRKALAERNATLTVYDEELWTRNLSYRIQDRTLALRLFAALRASNAALFRLLPADAWERTGIHEEKGEVSIEDLFATYWEHAEVHLEQIERLKKSFAERR